MKIKKQGTALTGTASLVIRCVCRLLLLLLLVQIGPPSCLKRIELRRWRITYFFLPLPALTKGHKSNVITAHNLRSEKHMPGDDMNIRAVNYNFLFAKQNVALRLNRYLKRRACNAAQSQTFIRAYLCLTSAHSGLTFREWRTAGKTLA